MKIAIDIDNVIVNTTQRVLDYINARIPNFDIKIEDVKTYWIEDSLPAGYEWIVPQAFEDKEMWKGIALLEGAVEGIKRLYEEGHEIFFATATTAENFRKKVKYLTRCFDFFPEDYVRKHSISIKVKQLLNVDILIDDYTENFTGDRLYTAICLEYPWNEDFMDKAARTGDMKVQSWDGIYAAVHRIDGTEEEKRVYPIDFYYNGVIYENIDSVTDLIRKERAAGRDEDIDNELMVYVYSCMERIANSSGDEELYFDFDMFAALFSELDMLWREDRSVEVVNIGYDLDEQWEEKLYIFKNPFEEKYYGLNVSFSNWEGADYDLHSLYRVQQCEKIVTSWEKIEESEE